MALFFSASSVALANVASWRVAKWESYPTGTYVGEFDKSPVGNNSPSMSRFLLDRIHNVGGDFEDRLLLDTANPSAPEVPTATYWSPDGGLVYANSTADEGFLLGNEFGDSSSVVPSNGGIKDVGGNYIQYQEGEEWNLIGTIQNAPGGGPPNEGGFASNPGVFEEQYSLDATLLSNLDAGDNQHYISVVSYLGLTLTPFRIPQLDRCTYGASAVDAAQITISTTEIRQQTTTMTWTQGEFDADPATAEESQNTVTSFSGSIALVGIESDGTIHILKTGGGAATLSASTIAIDGKAFVKKYLQYKESYFYFGLAFLPGSAAEIDDSLDADKASMIGLRDATMSRTAGGGFNFVQETEFEKYHASGPLSRIIIAYKNPVLISGNVTFTEGPNLVEESRVFYQLPPDMRPL